MERVSLQQALKSIRTSMGRPIRREAVARMEMDGREILMVGYSVEHRSDELTWREYRVDIFTPDRKHGGFIVTRGR